MIYVLNNSHFTPLMFTKYPDGTLHVPHTEFRKIEDFVAQTTSIMVFDKTKPQREVKINLIDGRMEELLIFLRVLQELNCPAKSVKFLLGYLPYARDDKSDLSNANTYRMRLSPIYNNLFALLGIAENVVVLDPHSPDSLRRDRGYGALTAIDNLHFGNDLKDYAVLVPDKGARVRAALRAQSHDNPTMLFCNKIRTSNGVTTVLPDDIVNKRYVGKSFVIYDDICDGGATFIGIAQELRKVIPDATIILCVTHGLFTKGLRHLTENGIDEVRFLNTLHQLPDNPMEYVTRYTGD